MAPISLATFNIFWYPQHERPRNQRSAEDEERIVQVLASLGADALVFEEILDIERLEALLGKVQGRNYRVRDAAGRPIAGDGSMKITCAFDDNVLELVSHGMIPEPNEARKFFNRRYSPWFVLRSRATGKELTIAGAHAKSGLPESLDPNADPKRAWEIEAISRWCSERLVHDPHTPLVVIGDFNMVPDHPGFAAFEKADSPVVRVPARVFELLPEQDGGKLAPPSENWSTLLDKVITDHAFASPAAAAAIAEPAVVYAFDRDPAHGTPNIGGKHFLQIKEGYKLEAAPRPYGEVLNMYRVSDHRPLRLTIDL